jgi:penicillin-binding protein 2
MTVRARRQKRRRGFPGRLDLPGTESLGALARLRSTIAERGSALDAMDAEQRARVARSPGHFRIGLRLSIVAVIVVGLFSVLLVRLWSIQVIHASSALENAQASSTYPVYTSPPRGAVVARGGQPLATDRRELVITLKYSIAGNLRVASPTAEANLAALIPGLSLAKIKTQLNNQQYGPYTPVPIATGITTAEATTIGENPAEFPGAEVTDEYVREYPQGALASQMLGYLGPALTCPSTMSQSACATQIATLQKKGYLPTDEKGASGLEAQYETVLRGKDGIERELVDSAGVPGPTTSRTPATPGDDVELNLDLPLEQELMNAIAADITRLRSGSGSVPADWGAAVVLGPKGQVLAAASDPGYDNNVWDGGISEAEYHVLQTEQGQPLNDYVLTGDQPPGSTFKLATATAALDTGLISPTSAIDDPGYFDLPGSNQPLTDSNGESFGYINVTTALTVSSDVFFYNLGANFWDERSTLGDTPIQNVAAKYGYGEPSGIDLPDELPGQVGSPKLTAQLHHINPQAYPATQWYLGDNVELAFGQGETLVTPLEEADAYATFANGGTRYAPEMAGAIIGPTGKLVEKIPPKVEAHVSLPVSTYDAMLAGFEGAVQNPRGTAYNDFLNFNFNKWDIAGKTGTADVSVGSSLQPTAWFVAFGGPRNNPSERYTVAVEIDQAGYGADAAAPVAADIFKYLVAHGVPKLDIPSS